jgi:hypothetical protein
MQVTQHAGIHTRHTGSATVVKMVMGTTMHQAGKPKAPHEGITLSTGIGEAAMGLMLRTMERSQGEHFHEIAPQH